MTAKPWLSKAKPVTNVSLEAIDRWIVGLLVLTFTLLPAMLKLQMSDDGQNPLLKQAIWSFMYLACAIRLVQLRMLGDVIAKLNVVWIFCAYMLLTALWSVDRTATILNSIELIGSTVIGAYLATRFSLSEFLRILGYIFSISIVLTAVFLTVFRNHGYSFFGSGAWVGFFPEKNLLGASMSLGMLTFSAALSNSRGRDRFLSLVGIVLCAILVFGSNSMTSMLDVVLVACTIASIALWRSGIAGRLAVVAGVLVVAVAYASGVSVESILTLVGRTPSLSGRDEMWPFVKEAIADRPIFGYGYNAFFRSDIARGFFYSVVAFANRPPFHAHNSFLQILVAGGYVGLVIFCAGLAQSIFRSVAYYLNSREGTTFWPLAVLLFLTVGSSDETYFPVINSFEWLIFVAACLYATNDRTPEGRSGEVVIPPRSTVVVDPAATGNGVRRKHGPRMRSIR